MNDLLEEFLATTAGDLDSLDRQLLELEKYPDNGEIVANLYRLMHVVGGTAGFLDLSRTALLAHTMETSLRQVREGQASLTPEAIALILEAMNRIRDLLSDLEQTETEPEGEDNDLIQRLNLLAGLEQTAAALPESGRRDGRIAPSNLQTFEGLSRIYNDILSRAGRRNWISSKAENHIRLVCFGEPFSAEKAYGFSRYCHEHHNLSLRLAFGGYGCTEFGFNLEGNEGAGPSLSQIIQKDKKFQRQLNEMNVHLAKIQEGARHTIIAACHKVMVPFATNRPANDDFQVEGMGIRGVLGEGQSDELKFGIAETFVQDLGHGQDPENLLKRVWKRLKNNLPGLGSRKEQILVQSIEAINKPEFSELIDRSDAKAAIISIHGYANDFDSAMESFARWAVRTDVQRMGMLPVMFSWPSLGQTKDYLEDNDIAEESEISLIDFLTELSARAKSKSLNLLAHSHGNKLLMRAIGVKKGHLPDKSFNNLIFVEPDVAQTFFEQRIGNISRVCNQATVYFSRNDKALWVSEKIFNKRRVGRSGIRSKEGDYDNIDLVDASDVANGFVRHNPHIDAPEVIRDIQTVLKGSPPENQ